MRLGFFLDLRNPPGRRRDWIEHYRRSVESVVEAERLGIDAVWLTEHHLFEDGYLSQPLTFAAALAARTSRIRIGTGILIAALRHPRHVAEEAALVDQLSAGRLELGIGAGWSRPEYEAFGRDHKGRFAATEEAAVEIRRLLADPAFAPPPAQDPLPFWLGAVRPPGARRAGRLGAGLLSLDPALLGPYTEALKEAGQEPESARMGGLIEIVLATDPESARSRLRPFREHQMDSYASFRDQRDTRIAASHDELLVLTPEDAAAEILRRTEGLPVEHVYFWLSVGGMDDDLVEEHLRLTAGPLHALLSSDEGGSR